MPFYVDQLVFDQLSGDPSSPVNGETWLNTTEGKIKTKKNGQVVEIKTDHPLDKFDATVAPGVNDDSSAGYSAGSTWIDVTGNKHYICVDASVGAAVWEAAGAQGPQGPAGPDGDMTWQGAWVAQNYVVNQCVQYNGSAYVCKLNTVASEVPTNTTYWDLLCQSAGADIDIQHAGASDTVSTTSISYVDIPNMTLTTSNGSARVYKVFFSGVLECLGANKTIGFRLVINGTPVATTERILDNKTAGVRFEASTFCLSAALGTGIVIKAQYKSDGGAETRFHHRSLMIEGIA